MVTGPARSRDTWQSSNSHHLGLRGSSNSVAQSGCRFILRQDDANFLMNRLAFSMSHRTFKRPSKSLCMVCAEHFRHPAQVSSSIGSGQIISFLYHRCVVAEVANCTRATSGARLLPGSRFNNIGTVSYASQWLVRGSAPIACDSVAAFSQMHV